MINLTVLSIRKMVNSLESSMFITRKKSVSLRIEWKYGLGTQTPSKFICHVYNDRKEIRGLRILGFPSCPPAEKLLDAEPNWLCGRHWL